LGVLPPPKKKKIGGPKTSTFWRDFGLRDLLHKRRKLGQPFRPTQATISDAHFSGAKGRCPLKISQLVDSDQRLLMHTSLGMGLPQHFLTPEIRKLAKNMVALAYIVGICWENCTKLSYLMCPQGRKMFASDFGGPSPLKFCDQKRSF